MFVAGMIAVAHAEEPAAGPPAPVVERLAFDNRAAWPKLLEQIDARVYSWSHAESFTFRLKCQSDTSTWLDVGKMARHMKKIHPELRKGSPEWGVELARLSGQVSYDFAVHGAEIDLTSVNLGELVGAYKPADVKTLQVEINRRVNRTIFGSPNYMMTSADGFFQASELITAAAPTTTDAYELTVSSVDGAYTMIVDSVAGLPMQVTYANGSKVSYTFEDHPAGAVVTSITIIDPDGAIAERLTYDYVEQNAILVPSKVTFATQPDTTVTFSSWTFVDAVAPFLPRMDGAAGDAVQADD